MRLQFPQVFLHTGRLKLEGAHRIALAKQLVGLLVVDGYVVDVDFLARAFLDIGQRILDNSKVFEPQEVHFDKAHRFHNMAIVLGHQHIFAAFLVLNGADGSIFRQIVGTDDDATGVDTHLAVGVLQFLGIGEHGLERVVVALHDFPKLGYIAVAVLEVHFGRFALFVLDIVGEPPIGDVALDLVDDAKRHLLYASHVRNSRLAGHGTIRDDMGHFLFAVFFCNPFQHLAASRIVEVDINIGQRDTVGIEETFEQQVILQWVDIGNPKTVGHHTSGGRPTSGTHTDSQLLAGTSYVIGHNEEVSWETHRLDGVQFESDALLLLFGQLSSVTLVGTFPHQLGQVVGLEFDTVQFLVATQFDNLLLGSLLAHHHLAFLVAGKFVKQFLFANAAAIFCLRTERCRDVEHRHDGVAVDAVGFHFVGYLAGVLQRFRQIGKDGGHLVGRLEPFLFGIVQAVGIVEVLARAEADKTVMRLAVFLFHKMHIVGGNQFDIIFSGKLNQIFVYLLLLGIGVVGCVGFVGLVALHFEIEIVAKQILEPTHRLFRLFDVAFQYLLRNLATDTRRATD